MTEWTAQEILQQAQMNGISSMLGTIVYLRQRGESIDEWAKYLGEMFAPGWQGLRDASALDVMHSAVFNPVSLGGQLVSIDGDDKRASAVIDFPIKEMAEEIGVSVEEFDRVMTNIYNAIFDFLGINFTSQRDGERWTYELSY